ncbi:hypothetical protein BJV77DRAFT_963034 [Russula vinacea]|nr:hypothetical protein BJV77DRAFT_963034 [Russula vinacea]
MRYAEDDPAGPLTPGSTTTIVTGSTPVAEKTSGKTRAVSLTRTASASTDGGDPDDEERIDPTSVPATPLDATPPSKALFQRGAASASVAPMMAKTKSSSSNSGKKESQASERSARTSNIAIGLVPFPSSSPSREQGVVAGTPAEGDDGLSGRIPQMSTARARDGGRTQSGGAKGVISLEPDPEPEPEPGPELELVEPETDPDGDDF